MFILARRPASQAFFNPVIDDSEPTAAQRVMNDRLIAVLHELNMFESEEEGHARQLILAELDDITQEWVSEVSIKKGMPEHVAAKVQAKLCTFGSYRLGVHSSGTTPCLTFFQMLNVRKPASSCSRAIRQARILTHFVSVHHT